MLNCKQERRNITLKQRKEKATLHVKKLDDVQALMDIHSNPIFDEEGWEILLRKQYGEKDHSVELKEGREGATYVDFDFQEGRWVSPESRYIFGGDDETDCAEAIRIAYECLAAVREEIQWAREAENGN